MSGSEPSSINVLPTRWVAAGDDRFGDHRGLGISVIDFKVVPQDSNGLFILENTFHAQGGPVRHLHYDQDEWFYALEANLSSKSVQNASNSSRAIHCWRRARSRTSGLMWVRHVAAF